MTLEADVRLRRGDLSLDVALSVPDGAILAVLGPNGAGKSTLLAALAGLLPLDAGRVTLDGEVLDDAASGRHMSPEQRSVGVIFQGGLLFPHLTALENVAFGLRARGLGRAAARGRAGELLGRLGVGAVAAQLPPTLSGGEAQRVALARALAQEPRLLLLDEPLSALDVTARGDVRRDLAAQLRQFGGATVLVTHEPIEAMALADEVLILEAGAVVQVGPPLEVARRPRSAYVADLAGVNLFRGRAHGGEVALRGGGSLAAADGAEGDVLAIVHPRSVALYAIQPAGSPRNVWRGVVDGVEGAGERLRVHVGGPVPIVAEVTAAAGAELGLAAGSPVFVSVKATEVSVYPA